MNQESLIEGICRSLKKNAGWAVLIVAIAVSASFLVNRCAPSVYKTSSLLRIMTSANSNERDVAAEMNGVLSLKEVQESIAQKCDLDEKELKNTDLITITPAGSGLISLTIKHTDPSRLKEIGSAVIQALSEHFIGYSNEENEFTAKTLQKKLEHLEKSITTMRRRLVAKPEDEPIKADEDIVELENEIQQLEEKIDATSRLMQTTPQKIFYYQEEEAPQYKSLVRQLKVARNELAELFKSYKEKHPKVIACKNNISELEHRLSKATTKVKKQKNNPDYVALSRSKEDDLQKLGILKEDLDTRKKLAAVTFSSTSIEALQLRIAALEELHKKTLIELEETVMSQNTKSGRINVLKKDQLPPEVVGFTALQRDCLALFSGVLVAVFLLYTPAPMKTELINISGESIASTLATSLAFGAEQPTPMIGEPASVILEVPALVAEPLQLPCMVSEEEVLALKYDERLVSLNEPTSPTLKPYKDLVTNLQISMADSQTRIVLAGSAKEGTGKTTMIANVGVLMAQAGYSVLLIDANFRAPSIHRMFGLDNIRGLSNLLNGEMPYEIIQKSPVENLSIVSSGIAPLSPSDALGSSEMIKLLSNLKRRYEIILIDTPALLEYPETAILAGQTGAMIFLHREGESEENLKESKRVLCNAGARVFGYVKI